MAAIGTRPGFTLVFTSVWSCQQVLIFSQFKIMLDVLEDALRLMKYPIERIDGSVAQKDRQSAIDRFSKGMSGVLRLQPCFKVRVPNKSIRPL
jgi:superfamily II DNA/RNA helicase